MSFTRIEAVPVPIMCTPVKNHNISSHHNNSKYQRAKIIRINIYKSAACAGMHSDDDLSNDRTIAGRRENQEL